MLQEYNFEIGNMPASRQTQEYIEKELPYKVLMSLYENSRTSLRELGNEFDISYHAVSKVLERCEEEYKLAYTLELSEKALGFSEGRVIAIKFETLPEIDFLRDRLSNDIFVQNAYMASGDFDLLLYVVGLTSNDFVKWQFNLRVDFSEFKPTFKFSTVDAYMLGFFPMRNELLDQSSVLSSSEKRILGLLNSDSRMKLSEIVEKSKSTQMHVIYTIKKLKERGIIRRFSALTQNPDKKVFFAYTLANTPGKNHGALLSSFLDELTNEDFHEITNDYSLIINGVGSYDSIYMCDFYDGTVLAKKGSDLLQKLWAPENPKIEKAILTGVLVGLWPFHLEPYSEQKRILENLKKGHIAENDD
jgi:DNA-binding Lrp family transcriptional regulator